MDCEDYETERFKLCVLTPNLVGEEYLSWFDVPEAVQYIESAKQSMTMEKLQKYVQDKYESEDSMFFGIFSKESNQHVGNIKFEPINFKAGFAVLGVLIGASAWRGRGVFSEVSNCLSRELRKKGIQRIYLGVKKANTSAIKAYEKAGYEIDSTNYLKLNLSDSISMIKRL